jgi:hypothetical protein
MHPDLLGFWRPEQHSTDEQPAPADSTTGPVQAPVCVVVRTENVSKGPNASTCRRCRCHTAEMEYTNDLHSCKAAQRMAATLARPGMPESRLQLAGEWP